MSSLTPNTPAPQVPMVFKDTPTGFLQVKLTFARNGGPAPAVGDMHTGTISKHHQFLSFLFTCTSIFPS